MSNSLRPHESQHARPSCLSPTPGLYSNPCPSSRWCHLAISSSVCPFSSRPHSLPASGSFPTSQLFTSGGQSFGTSASASVLPMNIQGWFPLGRTGLVFNSREIFLYSIYKSIETFLWVRNYVHFTEGKWKVRERRWVPGFTLGDSGMCPVTCRYAQKLRKLLGAQEAEGRNQDWK